MSRACLPTAGACAGQFTANTMGMVSEALGPGAARLSAWCRPCSANARR